MPTAGTGPFWSVIIPAERTNQISNPSFEFGTTGWTGEVGVQLGSVSGTAAFGAWSAAVRGTAGPGTIPSGAGIGIGTFALENTDYTVSAYVWAPAGSVVTLQAYTAAIPSVPVGSVIGTGVGGWMRLSDTFNAGVVNDLTIHVRTLQTGIGTFYVDGVQLEKSNTATTYIDGEQPGCSWNGLPHASRSTRTANTRVGGSVVRLEDIGFTVDTSPGIGAAPFTTISQSYAQLDGGEFQRQRKAERRFNLTSVVSGTSWADLHYQRRRLIEALRIENAPTQQPMRILYSGAGGTVGINAVWDGGVQFDADGQSFSEGIVASFTAYDPDWSDQLQQGTTLVDNRIVGTMGNIIYRDPMGKWDNVQGSAAFVDPLGFDQKPIYGMVDSLDGGTLYALSNGIRMLPGPVYAEGLTYWAGTTYGTIGIGMLTGFPVTMVWDFDRSRLLIGGDSLIANGTTTGQLAVYQVASNTWGSVGFIGTGVSFTGAPNNSVINSILPWAPGTYFLGGHFHRVNSTLLGSNWNIIRWNGAVGGWSANPPVSTLGTGFVDNGFWSGGGSAPADLASLTKLDDTRILVGAKGNQLRGYGTGFNAAIYDVRGTSWGTIPGYRVPMNLSQPWAGQAYQAPDRTMYLAYGGTSTLGTTLLKLEGLTASGIGTVENTFSIGLAPDPDTEAWVVGGGFVINNIPSSSAIVRTNGFDYQPADFIVQATSENALLSQSGTLYVSFTGFAADPAAGTAAALGTIVNSGMSNVYPTLRIRNPSSGTVVIRQWANMTTKEYAWFALNMFPGETVELTTGPGRVAFQSTYRGDILSTIVAGSKLASWHLQPGQNIISFLADTDAVVADMYWTPRHHSADGTGIV